MIRTYYNERPGAELKALREQRHIPHQHTCPRCLKQWPCDKPHCSRMGEGYMAGDVPMQPVHFICNGCLGLPEETRVIVFPRRDEHTYHKRGHKQRGRRAA